MQGLKENNINFAAWPFVRFVFALIAGIGMGHWIRPQVHVFYLVCIIAGLSIALFFLMIGITKLRKFRNYPTLSVLFYIFLFALGWARMWHPDPLIQRGHFSHDPTDALIGFVADEPRITEKTIRFPVQVTHSVTDSLISARKGRLLLSIQRDSLNDLEQIYYYGDQLLIEADFNELKPSFNPNEFNYKQYMAGREIWHQSYLTHKQVKKIGENQGDDLIDFALGLRENMVAKLESILVEKDVHAIASTLVLGYRSDLDRDLLNTFSTTGTIHVLSVSGLHVGIIFSVFSFLLLWNRKSKWIWLKAVILIALIWLYALITGLSPSVLRASIMLSLGILALSMVRQNQIYNTIAFSAFILLMYNPRFLSDIGFQLSYLSVLGIVYFYPKFYLAPGFSNPILKTLWSYISISLAAQLATFPLVTYYFYFFPVYFLPANLFILLPATLILYIGILVLLLPSGGLQLFLAQFLEATIKITKEVLVYFGELPYSSLNLRWTESWHFLVLYLVVLAASFFVFHKKKTAIYLIFIGLILLGLDRSLQKYSERHLNQIKIYNVGKNTAIGIFQRENAYLYTNFKDEHDSTFEYSVKPSFLALAKPPNFIHHVDTFLNEDFLVYEHFIQLGNKTLFVFDRPMELQGNIAVDLFIVKNNSLHSISEMQDIMRFDQMILDGSNAWWYIQKMKVEAEKMKIPVYVLKDNFHYVW